MAGFWHAVAASIGTAGFFAKALRTARLLDEPALAALLLRPFQLDLLRSGHAKLLGALVDGYGERWTAELLAGWADKWRHRYHDLQGPAVWISSLPRLCRELGQAGEPTTAAAGLLLGQSCLWVRQMIDGGLQSPSPRRREQSLADLGPPLAAILDGASQVDATDVRDEAVGVLCGTDDLLGCLIATLRAMPAAMWNATGLDAVAAHGTAALEARRNRPARDRDDWSIELPDGCGCELCALLRTFLSDPAQTRLEWPLAKDGRRHVHNRIDAPELPVSHQTRRQGRPYTLVLTKTQALFAREAQQRDRDEQDLAWLVQNRVDRPASP